MNRGRAIQPERDCSFCAKPLPKLRNPGKRYCNGLCRQRDLYVADSNNGVKCLDCGKYYKRVGSHVVQRHGYESVAEYRWEHGLMARETRAEEHAEKMRKLASTKGNLEKGAPQRFKEGGNHGENIKEFWKNRRKKIKEKS